MQQATLAIRAQVPLEVLRDSIQPFPTFSEVFVDALAGLGRRSRWPRLRRVRRRVVVVDLLGRRVALALEVHVGVDGRRVVLDHLGVVGRVARLRVAEAASPWPTWSAPSSVGVMPLALPERRGALHAGLGRGGRDGSRSIGPAERVDHVRVELRAGAAAQLGERLVVVRRRLVRAVRRHRVVGVADRRRCARRAGCPRRAGRPGSRHRRSARGWSARGGRPGAARSAAPRMRSPMSVWRAMNVPLRRRSAGRACRARCAGPRPCRCRAARRPGGRAGGLWPSRPSSRATTSASRPTSWTCSPSVRVVLLERLEQHVAALLVGRAAGAPPCRRTCGGRRCRARCRRRAASSGTSTQPVAELIVEAVAVLAEGARGRARRCPSRVGRADAGRARRTRRRPCGRRARRRRHRVAEAGAEAREQRVAGRVAEGVVVGLEAVEVVEHEDRRDPPQGEDVLEVAHEAAAVAQAGERVGQRLRAAVAEHRQVDEEGHREAPDDRQHATAHAKRDREQVQAREVVGDEQRQREQREGDRHDEVAPAVQRARADVLRAHPRGPGEQQRRHRPAGLEDRARPARCRSRSAAGRCRRRRRRAMKLRGQRAPRARPASSRSARRRR